ncbi:MAG: tRNA preQ1(34) S-adenosylmethionine ribosyltransferase-isomerase QueA [Candidatus Aminicenantes bacterium]|nr:tRNA preQ1(34) S-adenosylmethionine ribosyltransferase-isomerase QueA [Candidatus Aminicenantes bacterium]
MELKKFDYHLPKGLIAQKPLPQRQESRMLVVNRKDNSIQHARFKDFSRYLEKNNLLVLNDTRVIPARTWGQKKGKEIEFLFLREVKPKTWEVLCRPAKKVRSKDLIEFSPSLKGEVTQILPEGRRLIQFSRNNVLDQLHKIGYAPLPPYIKRDRSETSLNNTDLQRYQTVFARNQGSVAAPTAGLHFTEEILKKIKQRGIAHTFITLDVGLATFQPVRVNNIQDHQMLTEEYHISKQSAQKIERAKKTSNPVVCVGTTTVRALESAAREEGIQSGHDSTDLFIYPGYKFKVADRLLTNFHLPCSTLLMLTAAFAGYDFLMQAYEEAVKEKYRFFSYGDCMYIR